MADAQKNTGANNPRLAVRKKTAKKKKTQESVGSFLDLAARTIFGIGTAWFVLVTAVLMLIVWLVAEPIPAVITSGAWILIGALSFKAVPEGFAGVLFIGGKPQQFLDVGWRWLIIPVICRLTLKNVQRQSKNVTVIDIFCSLELPEKGAKKSEDKGGMIRLKAREVNITFEPNLEPRKDTHGKPLETALDALKRFFLYSDADLWEMISDSVQSSIKTLVNERDLIAVMRNSQDLVRDKALEAVKADLQRLEAPVKVIHLSMNGNFQPENEKVLEEIERAERVKIQQRADLRDMDRRIQVAEKLKTVLANEAGAYGLSEATKSEGLMILEQMKIQMELAKSSSSKWVISNDLLGAARGFLAKIGAK